MKENETNECSGADQGNPEIRLLAASSILNYSKKEAVAEEN